MAKKKAIQEKTAAKRFESPEAILEFVDNFLAAKPKKLTRREEKARAEIREYLFEGITRKRYDPFLYGMFFR